MITHWVAGGENSSSSPEVETWISQSQDVHTISPWLCKKGDNWVVWILNCHVHDISKTFIPSSSTESVSHYGDLIWDTCQTRQGWGNVEELSWDSGSRQKVLERGAWAGPSGYTKVSHPTPWRLRSRLLSNYG